MSATTSAPMIEVRDLTKNYGNFTALQGLTFQVPKGQVVGFLGPNGAGKSTTMKILTGYASQTSGSAAVAGIDVHADPVAARSNTQMLSLWLIGLVLRACGAETSPLARWYAMLAPVMPPPITTCPKCLPIFYTLVMQIQPVRPA